VQLKSPTGKVFGPINKGQRYLPSANAGDPSNADGRVYMENGWIPTNNGDANVYIEVSDLSGTPKPRNGNWVVTLIPTTSPQPAPGYIDFWSYSELTPTYPQESFTLRQSYDITLGAPSTADSIVSVAAHVSKTSWISSAPGQPGPWSYGPSFVLNQIAPFSSFGPRRDGVMKPDLSAPGSVIASALSTTWVAGGAAAGWDPVLAVDDGKHAILQGTSMSAPAVTGALAMMLQQDPGMTPTLALQKLKANARVDAPVLSAGAVPNKRFGAGKLDLTNLVPNVDTVAPTVSLTRPNGGETFEVGTQESIEWSASDNVGVTAIDLAYSTDNGLNWNTIVTGLANSGSYLWAVPAPVTTQALVRVTAHDTQNQAQAQSAAVFTIQSNVNAGPTPLAFAVGRPTPSPFTGTTAIGFDLPAATAPGGTWKTTVRIYNVAGRAVRTLVDAELAPGPHSATWDGRDERGLRQPSGVFFVEVATPAHEGRVRAVYLR
jgi:hypothetical protein